MSTISLGTVEVADLTPKEHSQVVVSAFYMYLRAAGMEDTKARTMMANFCAIAQETLVRDVND